MSKSLSNLSIEKSIDLKFIDATFLKSSDDSPLLS